MKAVSLSKTFFFTLSLCFCYLVFNPKEPLVVIGLYLYSPMFYCYYSF